MGGVCFTCFRLEIPYLLKFRRFNPILFGVSGVAYFILGEDGAKMPYPCIF